MSKHSTLLEHYQSARGRLFYLGITFYASGGERHVLRVKADWDSFSVLGAHAYASCENQRSAYDIILQKPIPLSFEKRSLIGLELTNQACLVSHQDPGIHQSPASLTLGLQVCTTMPSLESMALGTELRSSYLHGKHSGNRALSFL